MSDADRSPPKSETTPRRRFARAGGSNRVGSLDLRTLEGRRFVAMMTELRREFGADAPERVLKELAALRLTHELCAADALAGDVRARADLVRLHNLVRRIETELARAKATAAAPPPSLKDHLERIAASRQAAPTTPAAPPHDDGEAAK